MQHSQPYAVFLTGMDAGRIAIRNYLSRNANVEFLPLAAADPRSADDGNRPGREPDVVVVGPELRQPLAAAGHLRQRSPGAQIVFLVPANRMETFRSSLPFVPLLSDAWTAAIEDSEDAVGAVILEAARAARRREEVKETLGRINMQISSSMAARGELVRRQHQLLVSERFMATVLAQAPDPIFALNLQGEVISSNAAALRLFADYPSGPNGQPALLLFSESARPEIENLFVRARAGDIVEKHETLITTGEQTLRRAAISLASIRDDQNEIVGFAMTLRDITQLREAENKLREVRRELAQVAGRTALAAMSAAIAHEIKQPLGAIVANANAGLRWLSRTPPNLDKARDTFNDIVTDGHRVSELIQSVRAMFTRGDQAVMPLDVNEIISDTIALMRGELEAVGIVVQLGLAPQLPLVLAPKVQLQQVMLNIVANAADAMRAVTDRRRALTIESAPAEHGGVAVQVEDSGTGIDPQNIAQIFDAFFTTKPNGMGMGLAICRSIVEAHGGTLSASAATPYGSVFRIVLPSEQR